MWKTDSISSIAIRGGDVENGILKPQITGFAIRGEEGKNGLKKLMLLILFTSFDEKRFQNTP